MAFPCRSESKPKSILSILAGSWRNANRMHFESDSDTAVERRVSQLMFSHCWLNTLNRNTLSKMPLITAQTNSSRSIKCVQKTKFLSLLQLLLPTKAKDWNWLSPLIGFLIGLPISNHSVYHIVRQEKNCSNFLKKLVFWMVASKMALLWQLHCYTNNLLDQQ